MSLSDYMKLMRAVKGGVTPWEIAEATGIPSKEVHLLEVKHRRMGEDDEMLGKLNAEERRMLAQILDKLAPIE